MPKACYIERISTAVPQGFLNREQFERILEDMSPNPRNLKLLRRILRLTGIEKRHLAALDFQSSFDDAGGIYRRSPQQPAGPGMSARNAMFDRSAAPLVEAALAELPAVRLMDVDLLITASCTHASSPGLEKPVFACAAVPHSVDRWNLGFMGCSAALAGIRLVHYGAGAGKEALIVCCELSSLHFQYTERIDQMTANLLFSDGAATLLLSPQKSPVRVIDCRCASLPNSASQMVWFAGDHGLQLELSPDLPDTLGGCLPEVMVSFLKRHDLGLGDVDHWLVHPGGPQILDSVAHALNLPAGALGISRSILRQYGNMSSPTICFIIKELMEQKADGLAVALAFGPGLTIEMVLLEYS